MNDKQQTATGATAINVEQTRVYEPKVQPGHAAWTVLWRSPQGHVYVAFHEKRRGTNPTWKPIPLEFYEVMQSPVNYHTTTCNGGKDLVSESVVMRSDDEGKSWQEVGRSPSQVMNMFAWACLGDGSIIRALSDDYVAFDPGTTTRLCVEVSEDEGITWQMRSVIMEGYAAYSYRLKRLSDGTLILVAPYNEGFGPGRPCPRRIGKRAGVIVELTCGLFFSYDQGHTWSGPAPLFPGILAWEPDFVELPDGNLLFFNSTFQRGKPARQFVFRQGQRFIPGPVYEVPGDGIPETVTLTDDGLLVGAIRCGDYTCSNDQGVTWYRIEGLPTCEYQPYIMTMCDGSLLNVWHHGKDSFFGEISQFIGAHRFELKADMPAVTHLGIERELSTAGDRYINAYTVTLTADGIPQADKTINFAYQLRYTDDFACTDDPKQAGTRVTATTDKQGRATLDLRTLPDVIEVNHPQYRVAAKLDLVEDIHHQYRVTAWYEPKHDETLLAATRSDVYFAHTITMTRDELAAGVITTREIN